jgi:hypothetical protein
MLKDTVVSQGVQIPFKMRKSSLNRRPLEQSQVIPQQEIFLIQAKEIKSLQGIHPNLQNAILYSGLLELVLKRNLMIKICKSKGVPLLKNKQ